MSAKTWEPGDPVVAEDETDTFTRDLFELLDDIADGGGRFEWRAMPVTDDEMQEWLRWGSDPDPEAGGAVFPDWPWDGAQ